MKSLNYDGLVNAVVNDQKINGIGEFDNIYNYLFGGACAPFEDNYIAWNTAQGLYDCDNDHLEYAIEDEDIEEVARIVADYIDGCYNAYCEMFEDGDDEVAFDDMYDKCEAYIRDINTQVLTNDMCKHGIPKIVVNNFLSACDKDFDKYDIVASKYSEKYDYDFTSKKTKKMVRTALGW